MKKIWLWLLLLLLLILLCVWTKKDSIHLNTPTQISSAQINSSQENDGHYIEYSITQKDNAYVLNGNFTDTKQQNILADTIYAQGSQLVIKDTSTNTTLLGEDAIAFTNLILPHFIRHYKSGKIIYRDNKLTIYGDTESYDSQREMQRLLNTSKILSQDNTNVVIEKPIHFAITKNTNTIDFTGVFADREQESYLKEKLPKTASVQTSYAPHRIDHGAVPTTEKILSFFIEKYNNGKIIYENEILTVSGMVPTEDDLDTVNTLLKETNIKVVNHTSIDKEAIARARVAELARIKLEAERKVQALKLEEEKLRIAEQKVAQEKLNAIRKAQEEVKKVAPPQVSQEEEKKAAKEKITQLLKIENIEFEVAKGSLTSHGKTTVDKLAKILRQYPHIKIEIAGHTDSDGSAQFNQRLSQARVDTVKGRLIARGINPGRLTAKGYGESQPIAPNNSDENKQKNRRVEFNIQGE